MARHSPPVIPEITKAYENDPRTQLALAAMKAGSSTSPVAGYGYGVPDGIARIAQALAGTYINNKQEDQYGKDQDALLALRKQRGVDALSGAPAPPMPASPAPDATAPGAPPPQIAAIASALSGQPSPQPAPVQPPPQPAPAPIQGGAPMGGRPFVSPSVPGAEPVPADPPPVARPVAPAPVGATRSRMLDAAYHVMADANPYESAQGQDMYSSGLTDQTKLDESAAERKQRLADMSYQSDLGSYANAQAQDRAEAYSGKSDAEKRNYERETTAAGQTFKAGESKLERAKDIQVANIHAAAEIQAAKVRGAGGGMGLTDEESAALSKAAMEKRLDISKLTRFQAKNVAMALVDADHAGVPLDAIALHAYANLSANPTAQTKTMLIQAAPTVIDSMRDAGKKMNFSGLQPVGDFQAWAKGKTNDPDFRNYMSKRADVVQTLAQIMRGTGATDKAVALETDAAPKAMSPKAFDAWASAQFDQVLPRVDIAEKRGLLPHDAADAVREAAAKAKSTYEGTAPPAAAAPASSPWGKMVVR